jgi:subtilisin family serine protease
VRKLRPTLDVSVPDPVGLELTRSPTPPWSDAGQGAIVGVVDTGIDPAHEDFKTADGTGSRILYIWDQNTGEECTQATIESGGCGHVDADGHGTHVAGCAAGNGRAPVNGGPTYQYVGVAPEANIITVATTFYNDEILDGIEYIFSKAHQLGMPAVVNLSLGGQDGPHDGTDPFDVAMDALAGPGQIVVTSAGNEGDPAYPIHQYAEHQGSDVNLPFKHHDWDGYAYYGDVYITIWHRGSDSYNVRVVSPVSGDVTCRPGRTCTRVIDQKLTTLQIDNPGTSEVEHNGEKQVGIYLMGYTASGTWNIYLIDNQLGAGTPHWMHSWIFWDDTYLTRFINGDNQITISSPGSAKSIITVGAQTTKTDWTDIDGNPQQVTGQTIGDISTYSSRGPIRDGRFKPDVTAPGTVIGAAMTGEVPVSDPGYAYRKYILADGQHWILMGTSMASPHVAGLVAILLGADLSYTYTPAALKSVLAYSADRSSPVTGAPNSTWGYGKAKADAAATWAAGDSPRFTGAANQPLPATVDSTLKAAGSGFSSDRGSSERYLYPWQAFNGSFFENIPGATHRRLEPQAFSAGSLIRVVMTPYEHAGGLAGYDGLLLGRSITAEQTIQPAAAFTSHTAGEQWHMFSIPTLDDSDIMNHFMNPFWQWNEGLQDYEHAASILRGQGYWIYVEAGEGLMQSLGSAAPEGDFVVELSYNTDAAATHPGRHLLGNPFNKPIYWENTYVSTNPSSFTQRVTEATDLIHNTYYTDYNNTAGTYKHYDLNDFEERDGKIFPWEGYFVYAKQHVYLMFPASQPAPAASQGGGYYPLPVESATHQQIHLTNEQSGPGQCSAGTSLTPWRLKISAASGMLRDDYNYIGIYPRSQPTYDLKDIPDAGTLNQNSHILLYMQHSDWGSLSENYCVDIRSSCNTRRHVWEMTAEARGLAEPVTITWQKPPDKWEMILTDTGTGTSIRMNEVTSYQYTPTSDEDRIFRILAKWEFPVEVRQIFGIFPPAPL